MSSTNLKVSIMAHTPNPEEVVAKSAKICYSAVGVDEIEKKLTPESISKFVSMLTDIGHESVLEHITFTFAIEGVSRALTHQLVRHRIASYSQQSQRYVRLGQFQYIIPEKIKKNKKAREIFIKTMEADQKAYDDIVDALLYDDIISYHKKQGTLTDTVAQSPESIVIEDFRLSNKKDYTSFEKQAIEEARYVFPNACETKIIVTMNARSLLNFFAHRCCNRAQSEIRILAWVMLKELRKIAPSIFKYAGPKCIKEICPEGNMACGKPYPKVC